MHTKARIATSAAAAITTSGLLTATAQAAIPNPDVPWGTHTEMRIDPATGRMAVAHITEYPNVTVRSAAPSVIQPAAGTGGLFLRTADGAVKGLLGQDGRSSLHRLPPV
ncbi:hypothetical protein ACFCY8_10355 [Streptomyces noursei]|uniref:hypothetical protein n=1 Tax=Streptomyces noursei TaxID=1971 RepID=UPI0035D8F401